MPSRRAALGIFAAGALAGSIEDLRAAHDAATENYARALVDEAVAASNAQLAAMTTERDQALADLAAAIQQRDEALAEVERLKRELGAAGVIVGAAVNAQTGGFDYANFERVEGLLGVPLTIARMFDGGSVATPSQVDNALADGRKVYFSIAQDVAATIRQDSALKTRIQGIARELAAVPGSALIQRHEPENPNKNISGAQFVEAQKIVYTWVKEVAPTVECGSANMTYQYLPNGRGASGTYIPDPQYVDWYGADNYTRSGPNIGEAKPLETDPAFQRWWTLVKDLPKPKRLIEYGVRGSTQDVTNQIIRADHAWITENNIEMVLFWLGWGDAGDWQTGFLNAKSIIQELYA